jgi:hypothetical protein
MLKLISEIKLPHVLYLAKGRGYLLKSVITTKATGQLNSFIPTPYIKTYAINNNNKNPRVKCLQRLYKDDDNLNTQSHALQYTYMPATQ